MDMDHPGDPPLSLRASKVGIRAGHVGRAFIEAREKYDFEWELGEAALTALIFAMLFLGYEVQERVLGLVSHGLVGLLLLLKFLGLAAARWGRRHSPGLGID